MKEAGQKRPHIKPLQPYEMSRKHKSVKTESRLVVARGWREGEMGKGC